MELDLNAPQSDEEDESLTTRKKVQKAKKTTQDTEKRNQFRLLYISKS